MKTKNRKRRGVPQRMDSFDTWMGLLVDVLNKVLRFSDDIHEPDGGEERHSIATANLSSPIGCNIVC